MAKVPDVPVEQLEKKAEKVEVQSPVLEQEVAAKVLLPPEIPSASEHQKDGELPAQGMQNQVDAKMHNQEQQQEQLPNEPQHVEEVPTSQQREKESAIISEVEGNNKKPQVDVNSEGQVKQPSQDRNARDVPQPNDPELQLAATTKRRENQVNKPKEETLQRGQADEKPEGGGALTEWDLLEVPPEIQRGEQENPDNAQAQQDNRPKPKIPLRPENVEIVQKAKPIDLSFVPVAGDHSSHPHMGAKDENGELGYIHDETALRKNPPPFEWSEQEEQSSCVMKDNNWRMMTQRVVVDLEDDRQKNEAGLKRDKIFCLVYTIESAHSRIPGILETWGPKCDGFMVGSTKTDKKLSAVEILHEGPEEYNNIWQKVRSMWSYIYDNYYEKYDWFHIGGDDLFLIVENMRQYLESEEIRTAANGGTYLPFGKETMQTPLLLGRRFAYMGNMDEIFNSGGSGYTMNKAALKLLVTEGFPNYFPHAHTFSEDTMVAKIFRKLGVLPYDTKDEDGGERYMPFLPGHHWGYRMPKDTAKDWYAKYSINIKEGPEHCSPKSVAFHYVKDEMMKRLFALAYGLCPEKYRNI